MKLNSNSFDDVKSGKKIREYRLYDEKRRLLKVGDLIRFQKLPNLEESILVQITQLLLYRDFYSQYSAFFEEDFKGRYKNVQDVVDDTYNGFYTKEEEQKYGAVTILIKKMN